MACVLLAIGSGCGDDGEGDGGGGSGGGAEDSGVDSAAAEPEPLAYTGTFTMGETIPAKHKCLMSVVGTGMGDNISPALEWTGGPAETKSFAVVLFDTKYNYFHWAVWDIPADVNALPEGIAKGYDIAEPAGAHQRGGHPSHFNEYFGPCSDAGAQAGVYEYRLYALDVASIEQPMDVDPAALRTTIEDASLAMTVWSGTPE